MSFVLSLCKLIFHRSFRSSLSTPPIILSTFALHAPLTMTHPSTAYLVVTPPIPTSALLDAYVSPTSTLLPTTNSPLGPHVVSSLVTHENKKGTAVSISPPVASLSPGTSTLTRAFFPTLLLPQTHHPRFQPQPQKIPPRSTPGSISCTRPALPLPRDQREPYLPRPSRRPFPPKPETPRPNHWILSPLSATSPAPPPLQFRRVTPRCPTERFR
jgi:hypothetical protein